MAVSVELQRILESCNTWADSAAIVDLDNALMIHALGKIPDEPIKGMLGGAIADMMAGSNVRAITEEFSRGRGPQSAKKLAAGVDEAYFRVGRRWHFAVRIESSHAGQYVLVLSGPKPVLGMAIAQAQAAASRLGGQQMI